MKILLIEDDKIIWPNIKEYLEENSFFVKLESFWDLWLKEANKNIYDLYIFDVMLPNMDWFEIAKKIRETNKKTPIIFLTAKEDLESKEIWFNLWADDYLTKPFKLKELLLRVRSIINRTSKVLWEDINKIVSGGIELNLDLKEVKRWEEKITLTPKEFILLEYLMKNKDKVVTKHEIIEYIWWINNDIWSDVTRVHILSLRKKINAGYDYDPIKTIRGIWFKFEENEQKK